MRLARSQWMLVALITMKTAISPVFGVRSGDALRPEVVDTFLRMRIVAAVLDTQAAESPYPGPTEGLIPVSSLVNPMISQARALGGAAQDAWGNPLLYWSDGRDYLILSLGSDGKKQFNYGAVPPYANVRTGWAGSDPTNDLLIVDGVAYRGPTSQTELLRRAMGELRSMGTACESFAVDNNNYPGPTEPIDVVARIATDVEPTYIRVLPKLDPWGNPYRFWSDTQHYALVSYGFDGVPDASYAGWRRTDFKALYTGPTTRPGQDLVFVDGQFVQWPAVVNNP